MPVLLESNGNLEDGLCAGKAKEDKTKVYGQTQPRHSILGTQSAGLSAGGRKEVTKKNMKRKKKGRLGKKNNQKERKKEL